MVSITETNKSSIANIFKQRDLNVTNHALDRLFIRCGFMTDVDIIRIADKLVTSLRHKIDRYGLKLFTKRRNVIKRKDMDNINSTCQIQVEGIQFVIANKSKVPEDFDNLVILTVIIKER